MQRPLLALLPFLALGLAVPATFPPAAHAEERGLGQVAMEGEVEASAVGDLRIRVSIRFDPEKFRLLRANAPDARRFLQDMTPSRAAFEWDGASARYDDAAHAVVIEVVQRGTVKNVGGGRWEMPLEGNTRLVRTTPEGAEKPTAWFEESGTWDDGTKFTAAYAYGLPPGATGARFDAATRVLSWRLAPAAAAAAEAPRLALDLRVRDKLMSTIYKVYGLGSDATATFWVAKAVFRNDGGLARNLRVRYRLGSYGEWSPWSKYPELAPGQTVVDVHYPVLDPSIAKLRSNTPANLLVEYAYEDAAGKRHEDDAAKKVVILGVNEYVFGNLTQGESFGTWQEEYNNAPLLAAWVTRNDPVVKQFAAMANRMAGGVGAGSDNASAVKVLRACYELLQRNDFSYQHPPALTERSVSFDVKSVQNVKLPRETLRDRSGTCIDLAILYAAMVNAVGLEPHLALVPGHCFPVVRLPDGKLYAVEVTGVQGGLRTGSADFDRVFQYGLDELKRHLEDGKIYLLDLHELWAKGVANPEIDDLPADILERWGITEEGRRGRDGPGPTPTPAADLSAIVGRWGGSMDGAKIDEELFLDALYVGVDGGDWKAGVRMEFTVAKDGQRRKVTVNGIYEGGRADGGAVRFAGRKLTRTEVATGAQNEIDYYPLVLRPGPDGRLSGQFEGEGGFTFTLLPKKDDEAPPPEEALPPELAGVEGSWGGRMGAHDLGQGVLLDEMYVDAAPGPEGWSADVKMLVRLSQKNDLKVELTVPARGGRRDGDVLRFATVPWDRWVPATGKRDQIAGNPLTLRLKPDGGLQGVFEGDSGFPFGLLRREGTAPAPLADLAGTWGGTLGEAKINDTLAVPEAVITLEPAGDGTWRGRVDMKFVVTTPDGGVEVGLTGAYPPGKVEGDVLKFPIASLTRKVLATGATSAMDANPMEVRREPDGRVEVKFVGDGGFTLTLARKAGTTPVRGPAAEPRAAVCVGSWGGTVNTTTPDGYFVETFTTEVRRAGPGVYEATQRFVVRLDMGGRADRLTVVGTFRGRASADGIVFTSTSRRRTLASTGASETLPEGTLEVRVADGKLTGRVGNPQAGWTPFSLAPAR